MSFRPLTTAALCIAALSAASAADPLDRTSAYSVRVDAEGHPLKGFFPMSFVHGLPHQPVQAGFTARQISSRDRGFYRGEPYSAGSPPDSFGLAWYRLAWSAETLASAISSSRAYKKDYVVNGISLASLSPAVDAKGKPRDLTRRGGLNLYDPATVSVLTEYVRAHARALGIGETDGTPRKNVLFWGLDNEWEGTTDYSPQARVGFAQWLEKAYGGKVAGLNEAWNASYADFRQAAEGKLPDATEYKTMPGAFLDFWNFESGHFVRTLAGMSEAMYQVDPLKRGTVHKSTQQTIEMPGANRARTFDHELFADLMRPISGGYYGIDMYGAGDRQAYETNYIYNCIRPADRGPGYGVMLCETNNHNGPGGQFASTFWRLLPNGLKAVDYFTLGFAGAKEDWDKFGFLDPATGRPKDKLFYAARWAHQVHRAEKFWTESAPADGLPKIAMLMPRRDVLLSDLSGRNPSRWAYPENHRWMVFRQLREQGYWVDAIPYTKLTPEYLRAYQGLFLIGADHLTRQEADTVKQFVQAGGVLVADTRAGYYDEHHRVRSQLDALLGVRLGESGGDISLQAEGKTLTAQGATTVTPAGAKALEMGSDLKPRAFLHSAGKGRVLYYPFELGSVRTEAEGIAKKSIEAAGPTAESEEYAASADEFLIGRVLGAQLAAVGLKPAYPVPQNLQGILRVEQPMTDASGNCAVVICNRSQAHLEAMAAGTLEFPLPQGPWKTAVWASAEDDGLLLVEIRPGTDGRLAVNLPEIRNAGVLYLFRNHGPLLGIPRLAAEERSIDGQTAKVKPGAVVPVTVQVFNPGPEALPEGTLTLQAVEGWKVTPGQIAAPAVPPGELKEFSFTVKVESRDERIKPDWLYPLVARWSAGETERAVCTVNVEAAPNPRRTAQLLSGNKSFPSTYPHRLDSGATYTYEGSPGPKDISDPVLKGKTGALVNGFTAKTGSRSSGDSPESIAKFQTTDAGIIFDLQQEREILKVWIVCGPGKARPEKVELFSSLDGNRFSSIGTLSEEPITSELRNETLSTRARYVKVQVTWPETGGTLDELEIWGRQP